MLRLQALSNKGHGWLLVLHSMVNVIPLDEPLGPAVILLVLDDCALPAKVSPFSRFPMGRSRWGLSSFLEPLMRFPSIVLQSGS